MQALLALGPGLVGPVDDETPVLSAEALRHAGAVVVIDDHASPLSDAATVLLPATGYGEGRGAFVNFAGRVQQVEKCLTPKGDWRPATLILGDLMDRLGTPAPPPGRIRERLSAEVQALADVDWEKLAASTGQDISGVDAASAAPPPTGYRLKP